LAIPAGAPGRRFRPAIPKVGGRAPGGSGVAQLPDLEARDPELGSVVHLESEGALPRLRPAALELRQRDVGRGERAEELAPDVARLQDVSLPELQRLGAVRVQVPALDRVVDALAEAEERVH